MILPYYYHGIALHVSADHSTRTCSPLKTVLEKIGDGYKAYCTTYKMHTMATYNGGTGCPLDRGIDIHTEDLEHIMFNKGEYVGHLEPTIEDIEEEKNLHFQTNPDAHTKNSITTK